MRRNLRKQISPWMVVDVTDSEGDDDFPSKENYDISNQLTANDKDKSEVFIVDLDSPERKPSTNNEDAAINGDTTVRNERKTEFNNKTSVREKISSANDVTLLQTNVVINDDKNDEDIELKASVPVKNRKRKGLLATIVDKKARTTQASKSKDELAFGETSEHRYAVELKYDKLTDDEEKDSKSSVIEYQSNGTMTRKCKDKGSIKDKDVRANTNTAVTEVRKKKKKGKKNGNKDSDSVGKYHSGKKTGRKNSNKRSINEVNTSTAVTEVRKKKKKKGKNNESKDSNSVVKYQSKKNRIESRNKGKASVKDKDVKGNINTAVTDVREKEFSRKADIREEDQRSSDTNVTLLPRNIIADENREDFKLEASVPIKSMKRKLRRAATAASKKIKIIQAALLEQKLAVDEVNQKLSLIDSANDKLNEDENKDSNYYMKYQSSKEIGKQDVDERPVIGFDKLNCKASTKDTYVTRYKNIAMAEARKKQLSSEAAVGQEEESSYTDVTLLLSNTITIDSDNDDDDQVIILKTEVSNKDEIKNESSRKINVE